jgi:Flp pilus assembly protein TadD
MYSGPKFLAWLAVVALMLNATAALCFTSRDVPAADLPTIAESPGATSSSEPSEGPPPATPQSLPTEIGITPPDSHEVSTANGSDRKDSLNHDTDAADFENNHGMSSSESQAAAEPSPPPPALDAGALSVAPELGAESLDAEINKASDPSLAASLRLTESARKRLVDGQIDDAMRELARAVSLDASDAFAYYYLGRAYLERGNYNQALTFFRRAEIGFGQRLDWAGQALSYEGLCNELSGKPTDAAEAYKQALAASPNNFRARVGYGRLASTAGPVENLDAPPPSQELSTPPPNASDESAPPEQPPGPPSD